MIGLVQLCVELHESFGLYGSQVDWLLCNWIVRSKVKHNFFVILFTINQPTYEPWRPKLLWNWTHNQTNCPYTWLWITHMRVFTLSLFKCESFFLRAMFSYDIMIKLTNGKKKFSYFINSLNSKSSSRFTQFLKLFYILLKLKRVCWRTVKQWNSSLEMNVSFNFSL